MSINNIIAICAKCGWSGFVFECEPDIDGDGNPGCPDCNAVVYTQSPLFDGFDSDTGYMVYNSDYVQRNALNNERTLRNFGFTNDKL